MNSALWVVQVLLAAAFVFVGVKKVFQYDRAKTSLPRGLVTFIGVSELLGGLGLLLPALTGILPWLTPLAAVGLAIIMILASIFHATRGEAQGIITTVVLLVLAVFVAYGRFVVLPL
jgi:uncharacterized membrane protein YphA (DoxX/SURF4 family)